jgi:high-affinity Fe2+/Pb2+ permease
MILVRDLVGTVSAIELAWLASAIIGLYLSHLNGWEAILDYRALGGKRNGRHRIAIGTIRREVVRGAVNAIFLGIGIVAALAPANPNATALGVAVSLGLLMASLAYNANSYLDRTDRIYLMRNGLQARDETGKFTKES